MAMVDIVICRRLQSDHIMNAYHGMIAQGKQMEEALKAQPVYEIVDAPLEKSMECRSGGLWC